MILLPLIFKSELGLTVERNDLPKARTFAFGTSCGGALIVGGKDEMKRACHSETQVPDDEQLGFVGEADRFVPGFADSILISEARDLFDGGSCQTRGVFELEKCWQCRIELN